MPPSPLPPVAGWVGADAPARRERDARQAGMSPGSIRGGTLVVSSPWRAGNDPFLPAACPAEAGEYGRGARLRVRHTLLRVL
jgi:hypothetical protein